jgi:spore coat protein A, manganese oxidase
MIHCHNLSHEDHDMMTQYQVGHHDIDCDAIESDRPRPLPAPDLVPHQPPAPEVTAPEVVDDSSGSGSSDSSSAESPAPVSGTTTGSSGGGA